MSKHLSQQGFTVIELLIASMVFALTLIVITTGVLQFSRQYYKGVISTSTQNTARALIDDISRTIQYGNGNVSNLYTIQGTSGTSTTPTAFCIGQTERYSFVLNRQINDTNKHALVADTISGCSSGTGALNVQSMTALPTATSGRELLGDRMRIVKFNISPVSGQASMYNLGVKVVYGDDDLLCIPAISGNNPGACAKTASPATATTFNGRSDLEDVQCRSVSGSQFCAVSELNTTVQMRVE